MSDSGVESKVKVPTKVNEENKKGIARNTNVIKKVVKKMEKVEGTKNDDKEEIDSVVDEDVKEKDNDDDNKQDSEEVNKKKVMQKKTLVKPEINRTATKKSKDTKRNNNGEADFKKEKIKDVLPEKDSDDKKEDIRNSDVDGNDEDDDNEDASDGEKKVPWLDQPLEVSGSRERKKVERFDLSFMMTSNNKKEIEEGEGSKLGACPRIDFQLKRTRPHNLKLLHKLLFGRPGSIHEIKKNIRSFSGFTFKKDTKDYERKKALLDRMTKNALKSIVEILDMEMGGSASKDVLAAHILDFLFKPKASNKKVEALKQTRSVKKTRKDDSSRRTGRASKQLENSASESEEQLENESEDEEENDYDKVDRGSKNKKEKSPSKDEDDDHGDKDDNVDDSGVVTKKIDTEDEDIDDATDKTKSDSEEEDEDDDWDGNHKKPKTKKNKRNAGNNSDIEKTKKRKPAPSINSKVKSRRGKVTKKIDSNDEDDSKVVVETNPLKRKKSEKKEEEQVVIETSSDDDEPLLKKKKSPPTDDDLKNLVKKILNGANLEEITMKTVCKQVYSAFPDFDLSSRKDFIKNTVRSIIS